MFERVVLFMICNVNWVVSFVICNANWAVLFVISTAMIFYMNKSNISNVYIYNNSTKVTFSNHRPHTRIKKRAHMT